MSPATTSPEQAPQPAHDPRPVGPLLRFLRRESIILATTLLLGLMVLPAAIFLLGTRLFGAGEEPLGLGGFFKRYLGDLLHGDPTACLLAVSPFLFLTLLRLLRWPLRRRSKPD